MSSVHTERRSDRQPGEGGDGRASENQTSDDIRGVQQGGRDVGQRLLDRKNFVPAGEIPTELVDRQERKRKLLKIVRWAALPVTIVVAIGSVIGLDEAEVINLQTLLNQRGDEPEELTEAEIDHIVTDAIPDTDVGGDTEGLSNESTESPIGIGDREPSAIAPDADTIPLWTEDGLVDLPTADSNETNEQAEVEEAPEFELIEVTPEVIKDHVGYFRALPFVLELEDEHTDEQRFDEQVAYQQLAEANPDEALARYQKFVEYAKEKGFEIVGFNTGVNMLEMLNNQGETRFFAVDAVMWAKEGQTLEETRFDYGIMHLEQMFKPQDMGLEDGDEQTYSYQNDYENLRVNSFVTVTSKEIRIIYRYYTGENKDIFGGEYEGVVPLVGENSRILYLMVADVRPPDRDIEVNPVAEDPIVQNAVIGLLMEDDAFEGRAFVVQFLAEEYDPTGADIPQNPRTSPQPWDTQEAVEFYSIDYGLKLVVNPSDRIITARVAIKTAYAAPSVSGPDGLMKVVYEYANHQEEPANEVLKQSSLLAALFYALSQSDQDMVYTPADWQMQK